MSLRPFLLASVLVLGASQASSAGVVFSDNFNAEPYGVPAASLTNFTIGGSIDVIGPGSGFDFYPGNGHYIDLDGTPSTSQNPAGSITTKTAFGAGTYSLNFNLGGSTRGDTNTVRVALGDFTTDITLASDAGFTTQAFTFKTTGGNLSFTNLGPSDNLGLLLDNVQVSAVPEPATWAMMILGFVGLGVFSTRRRRMVRAA